MARVVTEPCEWLRYTWLGNKMARVVTEPLECLRKTWLGNTMAQGWGIPQQRAIPPSQKFKKWGGSVGAPPKGSSGARAPVF